MNGAAQQATSADPTEALTWAESYASLGWWVFPIHSVRGGRCTCLRADCDRPGKHPRARHGLKDATTDLGRIRRWGDRWRSSNVAVATGPVSGLVVIDVDDERAFEALAGQYGLLPETIEQQTGRGRQLFFRYPDGATIRNATALGERPGVDLRGDGGYVIVPPSQHVNGKRYIWELSSDPTDGAQLADLPAAWVRLLAQPDAPKSQTTETEATKVLREGQRNDGLFRLASSLRAKGLSPGAIEAALLHENPMRCDPPLSRGEVRSIAQSTGRFEPGTGEDEPARDPWPEPPDACAYSGLAGDVVRIIGPHSEADPVALLAQFLVAFGSVIDRGPHFVAEADPHYTNIFVVLSGRTSKGRKGTSWGHVVNLFRAVDSHWADNRVLSGLSSGEGLIWQVRDPITKRQPVYGGKPRRIVEYEEVVADDGEDDKRCLIIETEFASPLKVIGREGNTLSPIIRQAWDTGTLRALTKNSPARATGAHISIIGHVTRDELRRRIAETELGNGFANRFLWLCVRRSKCLPEGGCLHDVSALQRRITELVTFAHGVARMERDADARALWAEVYPNLSEGKPGLLGAATSRAEAITLRLSCLYALLDRSAVVRVGHLRAALALWSYAQRSARYIFGSALGDPVADEILAALKVRPKGVTRTELREYFGRHKTSGEIGRALGVLLDHGLAQMEHEQSGGRPTERWFACHKACAVSAISAKRTGNEGVTALKALTAQPSEERT